MKALRRVFRWILGLGLTLVALVLAAFLALQTDWLRDRLLTIAERTLAESGLTIQVRNLDGLLPFDFTLGLLAISDAKGAWLTVEALGLRWDPWRLLQGEVQVGRLVASRIAIDRLPEGGTEEPADEPPAEIRVAIPEIPKALPRVYVEQLAIDRLELGAGIVGEAMDLTIEGGMQTLPGPEVSARFEVQRLDERSLDATLRARVTGSPPNLELTLKAEDRGGLVRRLAGNPGEEPLQLELDGAGTGASWNGRIALAAGGYGRIDATIGLAVEPSARVAIKGDVAPDAGVIPSELAEIVGERLGFGVTIEQTGARLLAIRSLNLDLRAGRLSATGGLDLDADSIDARIEANMPDLSPLGTLAGETMRGEAVLSLDVAGPLAKPDAKVKLRSESFAGYGVDLVDVWLDADVSVAAPLGSDFPKPTVTLSGEVATLRPAALPDFPDGPLAIDAQFSMPSSEAVRVESLSARGPGLRVDLAGNVDLQSLAGDAHLSAHMDDPSIWATALGSPVGAGAVRLDVNSRFDASAGDAIAEVTGRVGGLQVLPDGLGPVLGDELSIDTRAAINGGDVLRVESLKLLSAGAVLTGSGEAGLKSRHIAAKAELDVPDLGVLSTLAGAELAGRGTLSADVGGSLDVPTLDATAQLSPLAAGGRDLHRFSAKLSAVDLTTDPSGDLSLEVGPDQALLRLATTFMLTEPELVLPALALSGPGSDFDGELAFNLDDTLVRGRLNGAVGDLRSLVYWHTDSQLAGELVADVQLEPRDGKQAAAAQLRGSELAGAFGLVDTVAADLRIADALSLEGLDAKLTANGYAGDGYAIDRADVTASGSLARLDLDLRARGEVYREMDLSANATIETGDSGAVVVVQQLSGDFAGQPFDLARPATVEVVDGRTRVASLDLGFGEARLTADVGYGPGQLAGEVRLTSLPLTLLDEVTDLNAVGTLEATVKLDGTPAAPDAALSVRARDVALTGQDLGNLPPGNLALDATLGGGRLETSLDAKDITREPIQMRLGVPLELSLDPFQFALADGGPLSGSLRARPDLGRLSRLVELDDQILEGMLDVDLRLAGTVARPEASGHATLIDASYGNGALGTVLQNIELKVVAAGRSVRLETLQATDGQAGRISGRGELSLDYDDLLDFSGRLELANAVLVRSDNLSLTLSGDLATEGDPTAGQATGRLTVNQAEFRIPDRFGPSVPTIDVVEVYEGELLADASAAPSGPGYQLGLDVRVAIPGRVFVRGRGLESEWFGNMDVGGTSEEPKITGSLEIRRGYFDFLDRRFDLSRGLIEFFGSSPPAPTMNIEARAQGADMVAILKLEGAVNSPELTLESEPEMPSDEVLSRLLFERDSSELSAAEALRLVAAVRTLTGNSGTDLMGQARAATGLDTLEVGASTEGASLEAGKYLTEDVFLEVITGFGDQSTRVRVEKQLTPRFSIESDVDQNSNSSFGINWRYDY